jgi:hypothetical protein
MSSIRQPRKGKYLLCMAEVLGEVNIGADFRERVEEVVHGGKAFLHELLLSGDTSIWVALLDHLSIDLSNAAKGLLSRAITLLTI